MEEKDLKKTLRNKKIRKYALILIALACVIGTVVSLSVDGKDTKLADGQGNIVVNTSGDAAESENLAVTEGENAATVEFKDEKTVAEVVKEVKTAKEIKLTEEQKKDTTSKEIEVDNSTDFTASNAGNTALRPETPENVTVTLEIRCDTLSENMDYLENESIRDYIPKDGTILKKTTYQGTTDNNVFDVLNTLCRNNDIQLEFSYTPLYESYYIEGINYLYEFDGGPQSGWMYKVNDWFPNYGCSSYYLSDGDEIVFCYTCRGLGADVGETFMS